MRPVSVTQTGAGKSAMIVHDYLPVPGNISLSTVCTAPVNYDIEHTFDDVLAVSYVAANGNWFKTQLSNMIGATTNQYGFVQGPIKATRINQNAGAGSVTLTAIQGTASN